MNPQIKHAYNEILIDERPVYFYRGKEEYIPSQDIVIKQTDCGFEFKTSSPIPVTIVFPCFNRRILIGDQYNYLDYKTPKNFYSPGPTHLLERSIYEINTSVIHLVQNNVWSFSVYGEAIISVFNKIYENYASITGVPDADNNIVFYLDVAVNYLINLQRQPIQPRFVTFVDCLNQQELNDAIFYGSTLSRVENSNEQCIELAKQFQEILPDAVYIGSMAEILNGISCFVSDYDLMFDTYDNMIYGSENLQDHGFEVLLINEKNIKLSRNGITIDLTYDNYRLMSEGYTLESNRLKYFDVRGLEWLCLLNLYEQYNTLYEDSYKRNNRALYEISRHCVKHRLPCNTKLSQNWEEDEQKTKRAMEISSLLKQSKRIFIDARINEPFRINCFADMGRYLYSVINTGSSSDARVVVPHAIKKAEWIDVANNQRSVRIERKNSFSMIFIDNVDVPGIISIN